ncbi:MAG: cold-shock protein, partial [Marinilabiliales bacterium]
MKKGTVKFFNESKGFGFIIDDETKNEYFVHVSGLVDSVNEG